MSTTINNTLAADARKAFEEAVALHARCEAEVAAGRFVCQGPSICGSEGDGVSEKVASDRSLREEYGRAVDLLTRLLDRLVAEHTGFCGTFVDLVEAQRKNGYRPSFYEKGDEAVAVLADAYDFVAGLWGLPETSCRPERAKPQPKPALTLSSIKRKLRDLRDEAHRHTRSIDAKYFRSSGNEVRLGGGAGDFYEYGGAWDGTLKNLKEHARRCRDNGGDTVTIGGQWLCGNDLNDTFDPTDCEWFIDLTVDEILAIGRKA